MCHYAHALLVADAELIPAHLVETLAELPDSIWNNRDSLEHLSSDSVDDIKQLDEHLLVERLLALCLLRLHRRLAVGGGLAS